MRVTNANAQTNTLRSDLAKMFTVTITLLALSLSPLPTTWALSDKRLCADEKCERIISTGTAKINYASGEEGMIPFKIHSQVRIMSKSAGSNMKLWGVEINGRRGYANKDFIMENRIHVSDKELKYEMPVKPLKPAVETPKLEEQTVLNASETAEDPGTTTTSPLDALKLSILTEQDQSGSHEAGTPITPVQAKLQVVDGTELPLEALPATTERIENLTKAAEAKNEEIPTSNDEEFDDYEEDDDDYEEDEDATLDSKDNELPNDKIVANVAESSSAASSAGTETATVAPVNQSAEVEAKQVPLAANLLKETVENKAETEVKLEQQPQAEIVEEASKPSELKNEQQTIETNELKFTEQTKQETVTETTPNEVKSQQIAAEIAEETVDSTMAAKQLLNDTEKLKTIDEIDGTAEAQTATVAVPIDNKQLNTETGKDLAAEIKTETVPNVLESQPTVAEAKEELKAAPIAAEAAKEELKAAPIAVQQQQEEMQVTTEAQTAAPIAEKVEEVIEEIPAPKVAQQNEAQRIEVEATTATNLVEETSTATPREEIVVPPSLPPLFKKQNFNNPNEYYKQLQEQQQQLAKEAAEQQEKEQQEQQQQQQLEKQQQEQQEKGRQQQEQQQLEQQQQLERQQQEQQEKERQQQEQQQQQQEEELRRKHQLEQQEEETRRQQQLQQQQEERRKQQQEEEESRRQQQTTPTPASQDAYEAVHQEEATTEPSLAQERPAVGSVEPIGVPAMPTEAAKEDAGPGLFTTIMDTVNSFISNQGQGQKEPETAPLTGHDELHRLLYPDKVAAEVDVQSEEYCKRAVDGDCHGSITMDNFAEVLASKVLDHSLLLLCVLIAAASSLFFMFVYYCFCNSSQEGALLSKLNHLERSLLAAHKENLILKHELMITRTKLSSIEDNSFGSNDMVAALKKELETELYEKAKLQEQVTSLEKDLDNAAEAGLELNKMLSEVLNGQNGDEAFMSTVEELQQQLNEQERIIIEINASLAEKSRENSELQYSFTESTTRLTSDMKSLQQDNYELEMEKAKLQTRIEEIQAESEQDLAKALEARNYEMQRLQHQIMEANAKFDKEHNELQTSLAKIEALEECLKLVKKDGNFNPQELIKSAKTRGELNAAQKKFLALQTKLEQELAAKTRLENQLKSSSSDVEQLKQDFNQSERDKLEAQTRLEVLSGYFREKETELQKELSLQEAKWLQHQGENASTVETQTLMKNEIQTLKSQNDELRAEIEAQIASHKAQMGTLENRAHESWLAARQSERRCEEAQAEAAGLRRKLTTMASGAGELSMDSLPANGSMLAPELNSNPSPLPLPLPGSPGLLSMPNPLPFLPAPFSPFMGLPPPFLPPAAAAGGARLPPLGRMRSPPPTSGSRGDRYDDRDDYSDYDDYDDEEEDERLMDRRRRHSGSWGRGGGGGGGGGGGHRDDYMHSPRTYRSLSPSDSRYNYNDTETDFSPPPSPPPPRKSSRPLNEV